MNKLIILGIIGIIAVVGLLKFIFAMPWWVLVGAAIIGSTFLPIWGTNE